MQGAISGRSVRRGRWHAALSAPGPVYEVACHEGNYAIENILRGARAFDDTTDAAVAEPGIICWDCEPAR